MKLGIAGMLIVLASLAHAADRPHNIFDDDWTPPKTATPATPTKKPVTPPVDPAPKIAPGPKLPATADITVTPTAAQNVRLAIPTSAAQTPVRNAMKEVFAEQIANRSVAARRKLIVALMAQVEKSADAPVDQFVLLAAVIDSSIEALNLPAAVRAADQMAEKFEVDPLAIKADAALRIGPKSTVPDIAAENVSAAMELAGALARADDYATSMRVCAAMQPAAAASGNAALRAQLQQRQHELTTARDAADRYARDLAKLKETPDDPAANLAVGRYRCLMKGDWENGLPMLAKGSDAALKTAAIFELSNPTSNDEVVHLGDLWWEAGAKQTDTMYRAALYSHASVHYSKAIEKVTGLRKVQIEKRIAEAAKVNSGASAKAASAQPGVVNLLKLIDIKRDCVEGQWNDGEPVATSLNSPPKGNARLAIRYQPPEEYDFHIEFTRKAGVPNTVLIFTHGNHRCVWLAGWENRLQGFETIGGADAGRNSTSVKGPSIADVGRRYSSVVQVRKTGIAAYLDGNLIAEYKTDGSDLGLKGRWSIGENPLGLGTSGNDTVFHVVELREVSGHGKALP